jgi:hypothetical protein
LANGITLNPKSRLQSHAAHQNFITLFLSQRIKDGIHLQAHHAGLVIAESLLQCWEALKPFLIAGAYGNYVTDEGDTIAREAYGCNYDRPVTLKNKFDPTNFFRMNHNIKPTIGPRKSDDVRTVQAGTM